MQSTCLSVRLLKTCSVFSLFFSASRLGGSVLHAVSVKSATATPAVSFWASRARNSSPMSLVDLGVGRGPYRNQGRSNTIRPHGCPFSQPRTAPRKALSRPRAAASGSPTRRAGRSAACRRSCRTTPRSAAARPATPRGSPPAPRPCRPARRPGRPRSEEHTSELQSRPHLVCRLLLEKKNTHLLPILPYKKKNNKK